jgi:hypothetical protein
VIDGLTFTGTQEGMTLGQLSRVRALLRELSPKYVLHGACVGADDEFDEIAAVMGIKRHVFPSTVAAKRVSDARLRSRTGSEVVIHEAAQPLVRNRTMVNYGEAVIACPKSDAEVLRSGTWATIRYARRRRKLHEVVTPASAMLLERTP